MKTDDERISRVPDTATEARLLAIREQAARTGAVSGPGIRPAGAPFPRASMEAGYYGLPLLKKPQWTWEVPVYFFVGGAAGAAAVIAAIAGWAGAERSLVRDARKIAAAGALLSPPLLIADLGRPSRFYNMLRVFKPQSVMSMGAWTLSVFGPSAVASLVLELRRDLLPKFLRQALPAVAGNVAGATGMVMATYTGVLLGATVAPAWNQNAGILPIHFAASGLGSAVGMLELMGHQENRPLQALGIAAAIVECAVGARIERSSNPANQPLKEGASGWIVRAGGILSGPAALFLRVASSVTGERIAPRLRRAAALCSIAGSLLTRVGWVEAGNASSQDNRIPLALPESAQPVGTLTAGPR